MAQKTIETLGLRLLLARTRKRWTLADLRKATGIPESMLSSYERDIRRPTTDRLIMLARALDSDPNELLGFDATRRKLRKRLPAAFSAAA